MKPVAIVFGYNGSGYFGLQRQADGSGQPTVELELERALLAAGALQAKHAGALHRVNWSRTSRTDKGVSAAANVIALDVPAAALGQPTVRDSASGAGVSDGTRHSDSEGLAAWVGAMNAALPPAVRVWGATQPHAHFDARRAAFGRRYEYLVPVWALDPQVGSRRGTQPPPNTQAPPQPPHMPPPQPACSSQPQPAPPNPQQCISQQTAVPSSAIATVVTTLPQAHTSTPSLPSDAITAPLTQHNSLTTASTASAPAPGLTAPTQHDTPTINDGGIGRAITPSVACASPSAGARSVIAPSDGAGDAGVGNFGASSASGATAVAAAAASCGGGGQGGSTAERTQRRAEAEIAASRFQLGGLELRRLNLILGVLEGSHCFHNFTSEPTDDPEHLRRTIHRAYAEGPIYLQPPQPPQPLPGLANPSPTSPSPLSAPPQQPTVQLPHPQAPTSQPTTTTTAATTATAAATAATAAATTATVPSSLTATTTTTAAAPPPQPYVRIVFLGQGFLMHQIRCMVGLALAVARGAAPPECMRAALDPSRTHLTVPRAPPTGLFMDRAYFTPQSYRAACEASQPPTASQQSMQSQPHPQQSAGTAPQVAVEARSTVADGGGDGGDWCSQLGRLSDSAAVQTFKAEVLYPAIQEAGVMDMWAFLCGGMSEAAHGFKNWAKRRTTTFKSVAAPPLTSASGQAGQAARPLTAASGEAAQPARPLTAASGLPPPPATMTTMTGGGSPYTDVNGLETVTASRDASGAGGGEPGQEAATEGCVETARGKREGVEDASESDGVEGAGEGLRPGKRGRL